LTTLALSTLPLRTKTPAHGDTDAWLLAIALDCHQLDAVPTRHLLAQVTAVEIGRGDERAVRRDGDRLRIDLADRTASLVHLRMERTADGWTAYDAGSKNGTRVNGRAFHRGALNSGDVIECGGTFLVLRHDGGPILDRESDRGLPSPQTLLPSLERELAAVARIARSRVPVLVRGETGTGKDVVAAAIHEHSGRTGPLIAVNCAAIPATLLESELFGTRRGAFSGAEDRPGLVRNADHGTLFLDEIAELPLGSQAALLRFLQDGEVMTVGAGKPTSVDVRVVAATNRTVEELMGDGKFRRDLYARLRGYEVRLPPLRHRIEDLGHLVAALIARHALDSTPRTLSPTAARTMFLHPWPYNVRELEQALRTALAVADSPEIRLADLHLEPAEAPTAETTMRARLIALIDEHGGNLSAVARALTTSRSQLHRLMQRHAIEPAMIKRR
jgi:transcriptional regulator of acetoin/glycerol metabolism